MNDERRSTAPLFISPTVKAKVEKTNAARLLDRAGVEYALVPYEVDENDLAATRVARELGEAPRRVFKTLVLRGEKNGLFACVIPGDAEVDLKAAAKASGNKKVEMLPVKELLPATGYVRGGCSPVGMKKRLPTWIDPSCRQFDAIFVSAGVRGLQLRVNPDDLIRVTGAMVAGLINA
ncbi:MAG: Cys-tRNA(Pro) deacylase [Odoribacteraceae bacterium]|jgi:Cys-tRNA(Pro)/Cys-tRNA(Cys) deacylase|nr:Cys-tRNA(Pro) deacylase [Odoribacteraceae bacterium]